MSTRLTAAALLLVLVAACREEKLQPLTVGLVDTAGAALIYVAQDRDLFSKHHLKVSFVKYDLGRDALTDALDGKVDLATVYETPVVARAMEGKDVVVLSSLHRSAQATSIVARGDRGITGASSLRGKKVAFPRGSNADFFVHIVLEAEGLSEDAVVEVDTQPSDLLRRLISGEVDAISAWEPLASEAERSVPGAVRIGSDLYMEVSMLAGARERVTARHRECVAFLSALAEAEAFTRAHPDAALAIVQRHLPQVAPETLHDLWPRIRPGLGLDHVMAAVMTHEERWLARRAPSDHGFDASSAFDTSCLEEAAPDTLTFTPVR